MKQEKQNRLWLYSKIINLRGAAATVYEKALAKRVKPEDITKLTAPFNHELAQHIQKAATDDIGACVMAVDSLVGLNRGHENTMQELKKKIENNEKHVRAIKLALVQTMQSRGITNIEDEDFTAVLTSSDDGIRVELR